MYDQKPWLKFYGNVPATIDSAKDTRKILEESYSRTGNVEKSTKEITVRFMKDVPDGFMSKDVFVLVIGQMMNYIAKQM